MIRCRAEQLADVIRWWIGGEPVGLWRAVFGLMS
jgi:hypothetical protein